MNVKSSIFFLLFILGLNACKTGQNNNSDRPNFYLPAELSALDFNMPMQDVMAKRTNLAPVNYANDLFDFRKEFTEEFEQPIEGMQSLIYYFDAEGNKPFYELIIRFEDAASRDQLAKKLLGAPNHKNETEWMLEAKKGFKVHAWTFEKKLILVGLIPGTEWTEETNRD